MGSPTRARLVEAIRDGFARLADIAPGEIVVLVEENDWNLVVHDLRQVMDAQDELIADDRRELVEA